MTPRASTHSLIVIIAALAAMGAACKTTAPAPKPPAPAESPDLSSRGTTLRVVQLEPEPWTARDVAARASGIASVLEGKDVRAVGAEAVEKVLAANPAQAELLVESARQIRVHADRETSGLLAVQGVVADDYVSKGELDASKARGVFDRTIAELASRHLVGLEGLGLDKLRTGRVMQADVARGGRPTPRVKEYLFEVPRALNGIEVFGATVTISVHRNGAIASIRTLGLSPAPLPGTFTRQVPRTALLERAKRDNPGAEVVPLGLRYVPSSITGESAREVRPREAFRVFPIAEVDGRQVHGRGHWVFYPVDEEGARPVVWPRPEPGATGDLQKAQ
jgi:hypothetical protein